MFDTHCDEVSPSTASLRRPLMLCPSRLAELEQAWNLPILRSTLVHPSIYHFNKYNTAHDFKRFRGAYISSPSGWPFKPVRKLKAEGRPQGGIVPVQLFFKIELIFLDSLILKMYILLQNKYFLGWHGDVSAKKSFTREYRPAHRQRKWVMCLIGNNTGILRSDNA